MGLDMLSMSPAAAADAVPPGAPPPGSGKDTGEAGSFSAVVERLLEEPPSVESEASVSKGGAQGPTLVPVPGRPAATEADQDTSALLLALATPGWMVPQAPVAEAVPAEAQSDPVAGESQVPVEGGEASLDAASDLAIAFGAEATATAVPASAVAAEVTTPAETEFTASQTAQGPAAQGVVKGGVPAADADLRPTLPASQAPRPSRRGAEVEVSAAQDAGDVVPAPDAGNVRAEAARADVAPAPVPDTAVEQGEREPVAPTPERPPSPAVSPRGHIRLTPQGARLAAALGQGDGTTIRTVVTAAAAAESGRIVIEAGSSEDAAAVPVAATVRGFEGVAEEQAAPAAVRESATRFLNFDTSVAALAAEAFQVRSASDAGLGSSQDTSSWLRDRGAYDLRRSAPLPTLPDILDGRLPVVDPRAGAAIAASATTEAAVVPSGSVPDGTHAAMGEVPTQIVRAMHLQWREGVGEAKLTLTPESLGEVTISMKVDKGVVTATIKAENPVTMEWIRSHQHELRDALNAQGLKLDTLDISVDPDGRRRREEAAQPQAPRKSRPASGTDAPRFELVM